MATSVVKGVKEVQRAFLELEPKVARKVVRQALRKAVKPIQAAAKADAPVKSGKLKKAIKVRAMRRKKGRIGVLAIIGKGDFQGETWYGSVQEFGARKRRRIRAKHFMKKAYESKKAQAAAIAEAEIGPGIEREARS